MPPVSAVVNILYGIAVFRFFLLILKDIKRAFGDFADTRFQAVFAPF